MMSRYKQIEWTAENVKRIWDYTSGFPELYFTNQFGDIIINRFRKFIKKGNNVLDYGCGTGFLIPHLLKLGANVTGLDFSDESINSVNIRFSSSSGFKGAFRIDEVIKSGKKFDVLFLIEVIEHLDDKALNESFSNIKKMLSNDGILIITTPNEERLDESQVFCPNCEHLFHKWQHIRSWNQSTLSHCLEKNGFAVTESFVTDFSASLKRNQIRLAKLLIKKLLSKKLPHLACVCRPVK